MQKSIGNGRNINRVGVYDIRISPTNGQAPIRMFIASEFIGAAINKARRVCAEVHGFRPAGYNATVGATRMGVAALSRNPHAFAEALNRAKLLNEGDIVKGLRSLCAGPVQQRGYVAEQVQYISREDAERQLFEAFNA